MNRNFDAIVIGGGFFGLSLSLVLAEMKSVNRVAVLEQEATPMSRASYANQARVHNGYHYPRSLLTAVRSRESYLRFRDEYGEAVFSKMEKLYAISRDGSKVTAEQFRGFARRIGAPCRLAPTALRSLFDPERIEEVFLTDECAFDAAILCETILRRVSKTGKIDLLLGVRAEQVEKSAEGLIVNTSRGRFASNVVLNCCYSGMNRLNENSGEPAIPIKFELAEMALVTVPRPFRSLGITVMDGPFFSLMPFPSRGLHSLSHVRYTPHDWWHARDRHGARVSDPYELLDGFERKSNFRKMRADAARYIPNLWDLQYRESLWEIKAVLSNSEENDSRPILFSSSVNLPGYFCILGGKIDNIFDAQTELRQIIGS